MSRLLTSISVPGERHGWGLMDWGELTVEEMVRQYRDYATHLRAQAEAIEGAADADFRVTVVRGAQIERHVRTLQEGKPKPLKSRAMQEDGNV